MQPRNNPLNNCLLKPAYAFPYAENMTTLSETMILGEFLCAVFA
jgi:hypothetical protein